VKIQWVASLSGVFLASAASADAPVLPETEHAVVIHFNYGSTELTALFTLEQKLQDAITKAGTGEFYGNEVAADGSDGLPLYV